MTAPSGSAFTPFVFMVVLLAADAWVYADARERARRGAPVVVSAGTLEVGTPIAWFLGCLVLFIVFFPLYLTSRRRTG